MLVLCISYCNKKILKKFHFEGRPTVYNYYKARNKRILSEDEGTFFKFIQNLINFSSLLFFYCRLFVSFLKRNDNCSNKIFLLSEYQSPLMFSFIYKKQLCFWQDNRIMIKDFTCNTIDENPGLETLELCQHPALWLTENIWKPVSQCRSTSFLTLDTTLKFPTALNGRRCRRGHPTNKKLAKLLL